MAKVYSLHLIAPKGNANRPDFERFFHEAIKSAPGHNGMTVRLLKGEHGERRGGYLLMFEFECDEQPDPSCQEAERATWKMADEVIQWMAAANSTLAKWTEYATPIDMIYTNYKQV